MPAYNFQRRFAPAVKARAKLCTIRKKRKRPTKVGDTLYLYTGLRTKNVEKLLQAPCTHVLDFRISVGGGVYVDGRCLSVAELFELAVDDGFPDPASFYAYFESTYGLPFEDAEIICWD